MTDKMYGSCESVEEVVMDYGTIESGNRKTRSGLKSDAAGAEICGVLCFEMEAACFMITFPCLVIGSICNCANSHQKKKC